MISPVPYAMDTWSTSESPSPLAGLPSSLMSIADSEASRW